MKIVRIGAPETIMSHPESRYNYFGWPTVKRLQDGRIAVGASGFRKRHVCPYGKAVISYSSDGGKSYTSPIPVIDTSLDDRDCGIATFGESGMIVTSFNNTVAFQMKYADEEDRGHLSKITREDEARDIGANFCISHDGGVSFGNIHKSPVTSPHGPLELSDGTVLWLGRTFSPINDRLDNDCVQAYRILEGGEMEYVGQIDNISVEGGVPLLCEPTLLQLEDGTLLAHIRVQCYSVGLFTIYQSKSFDLGKTWTTPKQILADCGGAPAHLLRHSSGTLISVYGNRGAPVGAPPFGINAVFSEDGGEHWSEPQVIYENTVSHDLGYPSTVELDDGSLLSVFYAKRSEDEGAVIMQQKWRMEDEKI